MLLINQMSPLSYSNKCLIFFIIDKLIRTQTKLNNSTHNKFCVNNKNRRGRALLTTSHTKSSALTHYIKNLYQTIDYIH